MAHCVSSESVQKKITMDKLELETLQAISVNCWIAYLIALLIMLTLTIKTKYTGSSVITVAVVTVVFFCMGAYERFMIPITKDEDLINQYQTLIRYAWYYGFAGLKVISMIIIWRLHVAFTKPYSYLTRLLLVLTGAAIILQKTRLLERQSFKDEFIGEIAYQWGIIIYNITSASLAVLFALLAWLSLIHI